MFARFMLPGSVRVTFTARRVIDVVGVNSELSDGKHILMWDFDNASLMALDAMFRRLVEKHDLPDVHLFTSTGKVSSYHAYCLKAVSWREAVHIVSDAPLVDMSYLKWSMLRGRFTLRIGPKEERYMYKAATILGVSPPNVDFSDLQSYVRYETLPSNRTN